MTTTKTYAVAGMTCGHCVSAVTEELTRIPGVQDVSVDLVADATSSVRVVSETSLDDVQVRAAVDEAGYQLVDGTP